MDPRIKRGQQLASNLCTYDKITNVSHRTIIAAHAAWNMNLADSSCPSRHIDVQTEPEGVNQSLTDKADASH